VVTIGISIPSSFNICLPYNRHKHEEWHNAHVNFDFIELNHINNLLDSANSLAGIETMGIQEHLPRDNARWDLTMRTG
jgi:hypothetical protein